MKRGATGEPSTVAIVIVNWNAYEDTSECLWSLQQVAYANRRTVIIDNGSANGEADRLAQAFPEVHVIANEANEGFARASNHGIEWALAEGASYVLLLNNDTVVAPDFLTHMVEYMEDHPNAGLVVPLITYHGLDRIWYAGGQLNLWTGRTRHPGIDRPTAEAPSAPTPTQYATGCALLARAQLLREIGGLDDSMFIYYEDVDLSYRARVAGRDIAVVPSAVVEHKVSAALGRRGGNRFTSRQSFYLGRNKVWFARKHLHGLQRASFIASTVTLGMAEVIKRAATWDAPVAYARGLVNGVRAA